MASPGDVQVAVQGSSNEGLRIADFPPELQTLLRSVDKQGDGTLDKSELEDIFRAYVQAQKTSGTGHVPIATCPKELRDALSRIDFDNSGSISPIELGKAADLLEASKNQVKRLMWLSGALLLLLAGSLFAIGVLTFGVIEMTKETKASSSGMTYVAGTNTPAASASVTQTVSLYNSYTLSSADLKQVTSLSLSDKDNKFTYGWTITGFTKDTALSSVTFHSSRGDKILCTATKITATAACTPVAPATTCTGRKLVELTKQEVAASRRLLERRLSEVSAGRRLSASEVRRLQASAVLEPTFQKSVGSSTDDSMSEGESCPDGSAKVAGMDCPESCADGLPAVCGPDVTAECECRTECPDGQESCALRSGGWECDDVFVPFSNATQCQDKCDNWRDSVSGKCMVSCGDPHGTAVASGDEAKHCPVKCPATENKNLTNATGTMAENHMEEIWVWPDGDIPAQQLVDLRCPKLCDNGHMAWGPDFICPLKCFDVEGKAIIDPYMNHTVMWWPTSKDNTTVQAMRASCPRTCPGTGELAWGGSMCPIPCPGADGKPIEETYEWSHRFGKARLFWPPPDAKNKTMAQKRKLTCPIVCDVEDPWSSEQVLVYPPSTHCPIRCENEWGPTLLWGEGDVCQSASSSSSSGTSSTMPPTTTPTTTPTTPTTTFEETTTTPATTSEMVSTSDFGDSDSENYTTSLSSRRRYTTWTGTTSPVVQTVDYVQCPGKPSYCDGTVIEMMSDELDQCPHVCQKLRNCQWGQDGLIWPGSSDFCPVACREEDGSLMKDPWDHVFYNWGSGCPRRCPALVDAQGTAVQFGDNMMYRRLQAGSRRDIGAAEKHYLEHAESMAKADGRRLEGTFEPLAWPPAYVCPILCLNEDGTARTNDWGPVVVTPWVTNSNIGEWGEMERMPGTDDEIRAAMCPIQCDDPKTDLWYHTELNADGIWMPVAPRKENCPIECSNGHWVWPAWGGECPSGDEGSILDASTMGA